MLLVVLLMSFAVTLSACGTSKEKTDDKENGAEETKKTLRVVTDAAYAPFEYMDKGEIVGFDIDLVNAVVEEAGYKVNIEHVGWDPVFVEVEGKRADFGVSSITINDDRKQTYDFSVPYFLSTNKIMVKEGSEIKTAIDLIGKVVAVQNGTTGQLAMDKLLGKNNENIKKFENNNLAIMELNSGGADAVVADNTVVEEYAKNNPKDKLVVFEDQGTFEKEFYGLCFPKDSKLRAEIDAALKEVLNNGTYTKIYKDWFGVEPELELLKNQQ